MLTNLTAQDLQSFEEEIAQLYKEGKIRAPVHLRKSQDKSYENNLIEIFQRIRGQDYVLSYWASHAHCLLKGVSRQELRDQILKGNSISLCFWKDMGILCSGIVGSLIGVATGLAYSLKQQRSNATVWHFCGDITAQNGSFYEAVKYSWTHQLPIRFVVEDNGLSVMTDTETTWGASTKETIEMLQKYYPTYVKYFKYKNGYPHSGISERVKF